MCLFVWSLEFVYLFFFVRLCVRGFTIRLQMPGPIQIGGCPVYRTTRSIRTIAIGSTIRTIRTRNSTNESTIRNRSTIRTMLARMAR
jgi:hypothetical protein